MAAPTASSGTTEPDLVIAWTSRAQVEALFAAALAQTLVDDAVRARLRALVPWRSGPMVACARTGIVDVFLGDPAARWLLMVDTDMVFTPEDVLALLDAADPAARPVLGAACMASLDTADAMHLEAGWHDPHGRLRFLGADAAGLVEVEFVGAGMLLVHRGVFEHLAGVHPRPLPWFAETIHNGAVHGEDYEFCRRARGEGFPVFVHADVVIGHCRVAVVAPSAGGAL